VRASAGKLSERSGRDVRDHPSRSAAAQLVSDIFGVVDPRDCSSAPLSAGEAALRSASCRCQRLDQSLDAILNSAKTEGVALAVELNHTIVPVEDKSASATFLAEILGLDPPKPFGPFMCIETANGVSLDFDDRFGAVPAHYAFLVSEEEFDAIFARVIERGVRYWADPGHHEEGVINDNGRGFYFEYPSAHNMEVLTRPYGS
jgi:hypothetical protein